MDEQDWLTIKILLRILMRKLKLTWKRNLLVLQAIPIAWRSVCASNQCCSNWML